MRGRCHPRLATGLCLALWSTSVVLADGKAWRIDRDALRPLQEREQAAAIHFADGVEHMLITINVELAEDAAALWIFPVPGTPDTTKVDLVDQFPRFRGRDPRDVARWPVSVLMRSVRATQVLPLLSELTAPLGVSRGRDFEVLQVVEKWGIQAQVVTAKSLAGLRDCVLERGQPAPTDEELAAFAPYVGDQYVFVIAHVASREAVLREFPGMARTIPPGEDRHPTLYVEFATEQAFYPLRPTASYGDAEIALRLFVLGYVDVQTDPRLREKLRVRHFQQGSFSAPLPESFTAQLPNDHIPYTHIHAKLAADSLVDDLRFTPCTPAGLPYADWLAAHLNLWTGLAAWLLITAGLSYCVGGMCGVVVFRRWHPASTVALWNLLTIFGVLYAVQRAKLRLRPESGQYVPADSRTRWLFILLFMALFLIGTIVVQNLILWPLRA